MKLTNERLNVPPSRYDVRFFVIIIMSYQYIRLTPMDKKKSFDHFFFLIMTKNSKLWVR